MQVAESRAVNLGGKGFGVGDPPVWGVDKCRDEDRVWNVALDVFSLGSAVDVDVSGVQGSRLSI